MRRVNLLGLATLKGSDADELVRLCVGTFATRRGLNDSSLAIYQINGGQPFPTQVGS
jgi:hypothetical protein